MPLHEMLKKDHFQWTIEAVIDFQHLKHLMTQAPVLALPDFSQAFKLECDANDKGIGAVLMQGTRPICYLSETLCPRK